MTSTSDRSKTSVMSAQVSPPTSSATDCRRSSSRSQATTSLPSSVAWPALTRPLPMPPQPMSPIPSVDIGCSLGEKGAEIRSQGSVVSGQSQSSVVRKQRSEVSPERGALSPVSGLFLVGCSALADACKRSCRSDIPPRFSRHFVPGVHGARDTLEGEALEVRGADAGSVEVNDVRGDRFV